MNKPICICESEQISKLVSVAGCVKKRSFSCWKKEKKGKTEKEKKKEQLLAFNIQNMKNQPLKASIVDRAIKRSSWRKRGI